MIFYSEDDVIYLLKMESDGYAGCTDDEAREELRHRAKIDNFGIVLADKPHGHGEPKYCFSTARDEWDINYEIKCQYYNVCNAHLGERIARGTRPKTCPWGYFNYIAECEKQLREEYKKQKASEN